MLAYKFRSSAQIEFIFDILINQRLYCADWRTLNDPMEGMFFTHNARFEEQEMSKRVMGVEGVINAKHQYKVCSLSKTYKNYLLWSHYANGYDGVAIEVELPNDSYHIKNVEPRGNRYFLDLKNFENEDEAAKAILFSKHSVWAYEKEIRILSQNEFYPIVGQLKRVIIGVRMNQPFREALRIVCQHYSFAIERLVIGRSYFVTEPL